MHGFRDDFFRKFKISSFFLVMNVKDNIKGNFYFAFIFHFIILQTLWECLEYTWQTSN